MGLTDQIDADVKNAFDGDLSDAVKEVALIRATVNYDPNTGINTAVNDVHDTRAVVEPVNDTQIDGEVVRIGDVSFLILKSEIDIVPILDDIVDVAGDKHLVTSIVSDPADVLYTLVGRKS